MYHKCYASFWHTSMNFSFASTISRSISSSILLDSKVDFADNISITWFGRSVENKVISHCCLFYWLLYYLLKLQINFRLPGCPWPIWFSFLSYISLCLLTSCAFTLLLLIWQNIRNFDNVIINLMYLGKYFWSGALFGLSRARRDWRPRLKNSRPWKTPERNCSCPESPNHIL